MLFAPETSGKVDELLASVDMKRSHRSLKSIGHSDDRQRDDRETVVRGAGDDELFLGGNSHDASVKMSTVSKPIRPMC